jgi:hypothetical protein
VVGPRIEQLRSFLGDFLSKASMEIFRLIAVLMVIGFLEIVLQNEVSISKYIHNLETISITSTNTKKSKLLFCCATVQLRITCKYQTKNQFLPKKHTRQETNTIV